MTVGPMFQMLRIVPLVCLARRIRTQVKNPGSVRHVRKDLHGVLALYPISPVDTAQMPCGFSSPPVLAIKNSSNGS
ncbi:hypothetical protein BHE74_00021709 [Ensete ventricosum]|nr:hypothetical protein BHE74_00021709 [Ensete ventricosum]